MTEKKINKKNCDLDVLLTDIREMISDSETDDDINTDSANSAYKFAQKLFGIEEEKNG
jgi:hypothetical protein